MPIHGLANARSRENFEAAYYWGLNMESAKLNELSFNALSGFVNNAS